MFERYTETARRSIFWARYEAGDFGSSVIESGHVLLGILREDRALMERLVGPREITDQSSEKPAEIAEAESRIQQLVREMENTIANHDFIKARQCSGQERQLRKRLGIQGHIDDSATMKAIRAKIEAAMERHEGIAKSVDLPLSHECKRSLAHAAEEAKKLGHAHIGAGHLLVGLLDEKDSLPARVLGEYGLNAATVRGKIREARQ